MATTVTGSSSPDLLFGTGDPDDYIEGLEGDDTIEAGNGNDTIVGGAGSDSLFGGSGDDIFLIGASADYGLGETIDGGLDTDVIRFTSTTPGETLLLNANVTGIELVVIGTSAGDTSGTTALNVNVGAVVSAGMTLVGNDGANFLIGTIGFDSIAGNGGDDTLVGGSGDDTLSGGAGTDLMLGGVGSDTYFVDDASDIAAEAPLRSTGLVSSTSGGTQGNDFSGNPSISADGRYVAFDGTSTNLITPDANGGSFDVFVKDTWTGALVRVDEAADGTQGNFGGSGAAISADGRYVAFTSGSTNLVAGDTNGQGDVFVKDLQTGGIVIASATFGGTQGIFASSAAAISADGRYVAFQSSAGNLVGADTNTVSDIFVKDLQTGSLVRASVTSIGGQANSASTDAAISDDGRYVTFLSSATNLVAGDVNGFTDVFVKDLQTNAVTLVSVANDGTQATNSSSNSSISDDGRYVAFTSSAGNLAAGARNGFGNVYVKDLQTGAVTLASGSHDGSLVDGSASDAALSADGRFVVFTSSATNLVAGDNNGTSDVFVRGLLTGVITRLSTASDGAQSNGASFSGAVISADGLYVAFQSGATNLVAGDANADSDVFLAANVTFDPGGTDHVESGASHVLGLHMESLTLTGGGNIDGTGSELANTITGNVGDNLLDGGAGADTLAGGAGDDTYGVDQVGDMVTELPGGGTDLVRSAVSYVLGADLEHLALTGTGNIGGTGNAGNNAISGNAGNNTLDGGAGADTLAGGGGNDVYVVDDPADVVDEYRALALGQVSTSGDDNPANDESAAASASGDGRYVAFASNATNLLSGDANSASDIFVKDRQTGLTTRVSTDDFGGEANDASYNPSISGDGRYVAFVSDATDLEAGDANGAADVYVKDRQTGTLARVSEAAGGAGGDGASAGAAISADGGYVAFFSAATNLVAADANGQADVFLKNRVTGVVTLVSVSGGGVQGDGASGGTAVSADGRYVAFSSDATNLVAGDVNSAADIFVKDVQTGTLTRVSEAAGGAGANDGSDDASISADGRYVAFTSAATNLVSGDVNGFEDVFVNDLQTGTVTLVSASGGGTQGNADSASASISADGRFVSFLSGADNLVAGDTNGAADVFVKDLQSGAVVRLSVSAGGTEGDGVSQAPAITADGALVAFESYATNFLSGDANGGRDIFTAVNTLSDAGGVEEARSSASSYMLPDFVERLVLTGTAGIDGTGNALGNLITGNDGDNVLDGAAGSDTLVGGAGDDTYVLLGGSADYVVEEQLAGITRVSTSFSADPDVSDDGRFVAFTAGGYIDVKDLQSGTVVTASRSSAGILANSPTSAQASISADGRYVAFDSGATNLVTGDTNGQLDVFVKDLQTGAVTRASTTSAGAQVSSGSINATISDDGRYVAFESIASNLVAGDTNGENDIFVKDLQTGTLTRVSTTSAGGQASSGGGGSGSFRAAISADGRYVAFESTATNLVSGDFPADLDIFVKDLQTGMVTLASASGAGVYGNSSSRGPAISAGGHYVAFVSDATNLVAGDTNSAADVFVKDLQTGAIVRASTAADGVQANAASLLFDLGVSEDGRYVTFRSAATNLVTGDTNGFADVFVKDLLTGRIARVSVAADGTQGNNSSSNGPALSDDGRYVVFSSNAGNLVAGDGNGVADIFRAVNVLRDAGGTDTIRTDQSHVLDFNRENLELVGTGDIDGTGNVVANLITGNSGANVLDGAAGADTLAGGDGDDTYLVDDAGDVVTESAAEGADTVQSSVAYALTTNVENLQLTGVGNVNGTGNALPNAITGNSGDNRLDGAGDTDTLAGGAGDDTYFIEAGDTVAEESGAGTDTVRIASAYTLGDHLENLVLTGTADVDGSGNVLPNAITGNAGDNVLDGGSGADTLVGGGGDDFFLVDEAGDVTSDAPVHAITRESVDAFGGEAGGNSAGQLAISADGRYVAFGSFASDLVAGDTNGQWDIFLKDVLAGAVTLVSTDSANAQADGSSFSVAISADGRHVAFESSASNLVAGDANGTIDIFVKDLQTGTVTLASASAGGTQGDYQSGGAAISADGRYVAFHSSASNLVPGDVNGTDDIFVKDLLTGTVTLVSVSGGGEQGNSYSYEAAISADGRYVAFTSNANNLVAGDANAAPDIFVKDLQTGVVTLASAAADGTQGNSSSDGAAISADGRYVAFDSYSSNWGWFDFNFGTDVFVKDLQTGTLVLASSVSEIFSGIDPSSGASLSSDGRYVSFHSYASNLVPGDLLMEQDVFVKDLATGAIARLSVAGSGTEGNSGSQNAAISTDGTRVAFLSGASNFVAGDGNGSTDVFLAANVLKDPGGVDAVEAGASHALGLYIESLTLTGSANINGTGNPQDNTISGNSGNNLLDGAGGADTLVGGLGDDTYGVDQPGDVVIELPGGGADLVRSAVSYTLAGTELEHLTLIGIDPVDGTGNAGGNAITGNNGNNVIDGGVGTDTLAGGLGDDTYLLDDAGDVVIENAFEGVDTVLAPFNYVLGDEFENLQVTGAALTAIGNSGWNVITGNANANTLHGLAGSDTLAGGSGIDTLIGGDGDDTYVLDGDDVVIETAGEGSQDIVYTGQGYTLPAEVEHLLLIGSADVDVTGNELSNTIQGNSGANVIDGGAGEDFLFGYEGDDTFRVDNVRDAIFGADGDGHDTVEAVVTYVLPWGVEDLVLLTGADIGGTGNDYANFLIGNSGNNALGGGFGNDTLAGGPGADTLEGGDSDDTYLADTSDVLVELAEGGADLVLSDVDHALAEEVENLTLTGTGNAQGTGNAAANVITGNSGNNQLDGGGAGDTLAGEAGDDTYIVDALDMVVEDADGGADTVLAGLSYLLGDELENLTLTGGGNLAGTGNAAANVIAGGAGNDTLDGGAGADTLGGSGGNDHYFVDDAADLVVESGGGGDDTVHSLTGSYTLLEELESLVLESTGGAAGTGNALANYLYGNAGNDTLDGAEGDDFLKGDFGDDTYFADSVFDFVSESGGQGDDTVISTMNTYQLASEVEHLVLLGASALNGYGNPLANTITGNAENNYLDGLAGADTLAGGDGHDTYVVDEAGDAVVEGLSQGQDIVLSGISFTLPDNVEELALSGFFGAIDGAGNALDNRIYGNNSDNVIDGGAGADTASFENFTFSGVVVQLNATGAPNAFGLESGLDTLVNIENVTGSHSDDTIEGDAGANVLNGSNGVDTVSYLYVSNGPVALDLDFATAAVVGEGNDTVFGFENAVGSLFDDTLTGTAAANVLDGGAGGADRLEGRAGGDTYIVDDAGDVVIEDSADPLEIDGVRSTVSWTLGANLENLWLLDTAAIDGTGNALDNTILANASDNAMDGAGGTDLLSYEAGAIAGVTVSLATAGVQDTGGSGFDTALNFENLRGSGFDDRLTGNAGANILDGLAGADTLIGGAGGDTYVVTDAGDLVLETSTVPGEIDTVQSTMSYVLGANLENLVFIGGVNVNGTGNLLNNLITATFGANVLDGGGGNDTVSYAAENANFGIGVTVRLDLLFAQNTGGSGQDTLKSIENLVGTAYADSLTGSSTANRLEGGAGNDTIDGGAGVDTLVGGAGNDLFVASVATEVITELAEEGTDTVRSSATFTLGANLENLLLIGAANINGTGNSLGNVLTGNTGNNQLDGGAGADTLGGGEGNDTFVVDDSFDVVLEDSGPGAGASDLVQSSVDYFLADNVENLALTGGALNGFGNTLGNLITGNGNLNTLDGGDGDDTLDGSHGVDFLLGGPDNDTYLVGATGLPDFSGIVFVADVVVEAGSEGADTVRSSTSYTLPSDVENLVLTGAPFWRAYTGTGNDLDNTITGEGAARQRLYGEGGNDTLVGGTGADMLSGGSGDDILIWDAADTGINGGADSDTLRLDGSGVTLDLSGLAGSVIQDVEVIDLTGTGGNSIALAYGDVLAISSSTDVLRVDGNADDTFDITDFGGWTQEADQAVGANMYRTFTQSSVMLLVDTDIVNLFPL